MRVVIVGSGGREAALAWSARRHGHDVAVVGRWDTEATAGAGHGSDAGAGAGEGAGDGVDLVIVGPEAALVEGVADDCRRRGIACFGPTAALAKLEASKGFARDLADSLGIPGPRYARFEAGGHGDAVNWWRQLDRPVVVKQDGLAGGKGVVVPVDDKGTEAAIRATDGPFVVEERMTGPECSLLAICDGSHAVALPLVQDHKRIGEGDTGPNTGGMGAYAPAPVTGRQGPLDTDELVATFVQPVLDHFAAAGTPYVGMLYAGLMVTRSGPRLVEYNVRFGDPEAQAVLPLVESDFAAHALAAARGELAREQVRIRPGAAVTVVAAAAGYPGDPAVGDLIEFDTDVHSGMEHNPKVVAGAAPPADPSPGDVVEETDSVSDPDNGADAAAETGVVAGAGHPADPSAGDVVETGSVSDPDNGADAADSGVVAGAAHASDPSAGNVVETGSVSDDRADAGVDAGIRAGDGTDVIVFEAAVDRTSDEPRTAGGRVMAVTGLGPSLAAARVAAYRGIGGIRFAGMQVRRDIAWRAPGAGLGSYTEAGVDIAEGGRAVSGMRAAVEATHTSAVLHGVGSFGGVFSAKALVGMNDPVLVASTDGVGTKVELAARVGRVRGVGMDIVNHCVNDVLVQNARPLFFLDYLASSQLDAARVADTVAGMAEACRAAGCALLGGETAEMPGVYQDGAFDVAGTLIGVAEAAELLPRADVASGDVLIGIGSNGPHTNGYSLLRKVFEWTPLDVTPAGFDRPLIDALLEPHRSYLPVLEPVLGSGFVKALVHITGGGLPENVPRVLPDGIEAEIDYGSWPVPPLFALVRELVPRMSTVELHRTLNMGIGMVVICAPDDVPAVQSLIDEPTHIIGRLRPTP